MEWNLNNVEDENFLEYVSGIVKILFVVYKYWSCEWYNKWGG